MKNCIVAFIAVFGFSMVALPGCGGGTDTAVIEAPPENDPEMSAEEQAEYERAMSEQMNQR